MTKIKSPLKHKTKPQHGWSPYASHELYHENNPAVEEAEEEVEEKEPVINVDNIVDKPWETNQAKYNPSKTQKKEEKKEEEDKIDFDKPYTETGKTTENFLEEEQPPKALSRPKITKNNDGEWLVDGKKPDSSEDRLASALKPYIDSGEYDQDEIAKIRKRLTIAIEDGEDISNVSPIESKSTFSSAYKFFKDDEEPTKRAVDISRIIPTAKEIGDMIDGSTFFMEQNFVENYNDLLKKNGAHVDEGGRYKIDEAVPGLDYFKIYDNVTKSYSDPIYLGAGDALGSTNLVMWETASKEISEWINSGEKSQRTKNKEVFAQEKYVKQQLQNKDLMVNILGADALVYGEDGVVDYTNMLNSIIDYQTEGSLWSQTLTDKLSSYFMDQNPLVDESQLQYIIKDELKILSGQQIVEQDNRDYTEMIELGWFDGKKLNSITTNHRKNTLMHASIEERDLFYTLKKYRAAIAKYKNEMDEKGEPYGDMPDNIKKLKDKIDMLRSEWGGDVNKPYFGLFGDDTKVQGLINWETGKAINPEVNNEHDKKHDVIGGIPMTEEEYNNLSEIEKKKIELLQKQNGMTYGEALKFAMDNNILDLKKLNQEGKKVERVVINNKYAEEWLASKGIFPVIQGGESMDSEGRITQGRMSTKNGLVYDLPIDFIAQNSGRLIRDDGNAWYDDQSKTGRSTKYDSPLGYFGLLSRDKDQDFTWWESRMQDTDDPRESLNSYLSSDFVNYIDKYREDKSYFAKLDNLFYHMYDLGIDPASLNQTTTTAVADWGTQMVDLVATGFGNAFVQAGVGEEKVEVARSNRAMFDVLDLAAEEYDIVLSEEQEEIIKRGDFYKISEGVSNFVPAIVEFALIDVALKKTGAITGVPRLINNLTVGYRTTKGAKVGARTQRVLENSYRTKYAIPVSTEIKGTLGYSKFLKTRGYKVGRGYNAWGNVGKHAYYAIREEFKMKMAFDEDYKMGGGVAFYGIGQILNKIVPVSQYNRFNSIVNLGKGGVAGALSVQGAHNLEALVEDLKGNKTFMNAFNEHYGDEEWKLNMAIDAAVFGVIGVKSVANKASWQSTRNLRNGYVKLYKELYGQNNVYKNLPRKINPETGKLEIDWDKARKNPEKYTGVKDAGSKIDPLEQRYNAGIDLLNSTKKQLDIIDHHYGFQNNPDYAEAVLNKSGKNVIDIMNTMSPKGEGKWEFETTNDKKEENSNTRKIEDRDAAASFDFKNKKIIINTDHATPGKMPHEVIHFVFKEMFKANPEAATRFKMAIKEAFPGKFFMGVKVKDKSGKQTGEVKDMNIEEFIQNEYAVKSESIKAEEYVAYVAEILATPEQYGNLVYSKKTGTMEIGTDNVFTRIRNGINKFSNERRGSNIFGKNTSKQEIIMFLANFSKSVKGGSITEKQIKMFEKFNLPEGPLLEDTRVDSRNEGDIILTKMDKEMSSKKLNESKRRSQETQDIYDNVYKKAKTEEEKDKVISDYFIGGRNAKKGTELYEYEIRRQNKGKSEEQIQKLIEKGPPRLQVKGQFDDIVGDAISKLYPDLTYAERQSFFKDIMVDPFKSEKAQARGVSGLIKKYRPEEGQNLTQMVREHLVGGGKAGFSRLHEIKGRAGGEVFEGFRRSIGTETGEVRESELGSTKQKEFDAKAKVTKRGRLDIVESLKLENNVEDINRKAGDVIEKSKLQEMTTRKIGENMLSTTRPLVEGIFGRTPEFYKEMNSGAKGKSTEYKQIVANTRNVLFDNAKIFHAAIQKQISEMTGEVSGSMKKFADLFEPTGKRMQFGEMPSWMDLTASQKARGPFVFIKKQFNKSDLDGKRAFLDFMYTNPNTGKKLTNAQVNTRVENLIDQVAISMGAQRAAKLIDQPGYKDMVLSKEGMGKMFDRQAENLRFLNQEVQLNKVKEQVRDTLDNALSSKKAAMGIRRDGVAVENRFIHLGQAGLKSKEILDVLEKEYPWVTEIRKELENIDMSGLTAMDIMQASSKGRKIFEEGDLGKVEVNSLELFTGVVSGKKGAGKTVNDVVLEVAKEIGLKTKPEVDQNGNITNKGKYVDLSSGTTKMRDPKLAKDFLVDFMDRVAKKVGIEVLFHPSFQKMMGEGYIRPNFGIIEYRTKSGGELIRVSSEKDVPAEYRKPMSTAKGPNKGVGMRSVQLSAEAAKKYIEKYAEKLTKKSKIDLTHVKITSNSVFLKNWNEFVTMVQEKGLTGDTLKSAIKKFANDKLSAKGDYAATKKANKELLEYYSNSLREVYNDYKKEGREEFGLNNLHLLYQIQTNIGLGPFRGLATHKSGTLELGEGMEFNAKGDIVGGPGKYYRSEHFFQNANLVGNNLIATMRYSNNKTEFLNIHRRASGLFGQAGITKRHQVKVDENGNTTNIIEKEGISEKDFGEFNIFTDRAVLEKTIDFESGKMFSEIMYPTVSKVLVLNNLRKIIKSKGLNVEGKTNSELVASSKKIDQAIANGRKANKERKGMSTWDFDDTLATTKSGVRARIPNPDGKPKPNRKVVFLAGGAGSGKGNVIKKLQLEKQGFKIVNSDISLEWLKKNSGLPENMNDLTKEQLSTLGKLQYQSRQISKGKMMKYQGNADGVVVDGTGGSIKSMEKLVKEFKDKGYDVSMLFVETSLETALTRNRNRKERSLLDKIVEKNHEAVQGNKDGFKTMFAERFMEVKTDDLKQEDAMPADLVGKMNDFVRSYEKVRLDAEQFATDGKKILDKGGEFDFSEFNVVTEGEQGPFFQKALERAKKFGTEHQYVLTARPPEAQIPIFEFLKSQGLNIPLKNIKGLGNSTGEAKAMWMLEKFAEGYNDMYFADDAMQNVKAVRDVLKQVDTRSKVEIAMENTKNIDRLDSPDVVDNVRSSKKHRNEYEKTISKSRPDLVELNAVSQNVDRMFDLIDGLNIPQGKKKKYEQIMTKWLATSKMILPEDGYKLKEAVELAEKHKEDVFSYRNPNQIIEKYAGKAKEKPTDPNTVKEFAKGTVTNKKHGITEHIVENTKEGQLAVRKVMDTHFGPKSNPWCLAQRKNGKLTENSWEMWEHYSDGPKSLVFQNGRLIGFKANEQYWDRMDNATDAPVITVKEGRVTKMVELVPIGEGRVQEFVMETRTTSKDKKTVTTEYHVEKSLDPEGYSVYPEGTKVIENKVNGVTTRETIIKPNGKTKKVTNFKDGKVIEARGFMLDGKTTRSINNVASIDVNKHGDRVNHEITEGKTDYWFGEVSMEAKGLKNVPSKHQEWVQGVAKNIYPIGFKTKKGFEVMDIMERVDGKLRVNFDKLRKIDPDVKGLPKEVIKPEGMRALEPVKKVLDQLDIKSETQQQMSSKKTNLSKDFNNILEEVKGIENYKVFSEGKARQLGKKKGAWKWWGSTGMEDFSGLVTYAFSGKGKRGEAHKEFFKENLQKPFDRAYNDMHVVKQTMSNDYQALRKAMPEITKQLRDNVGESVYTVENAIRTHLWKKAGYDVPGMSKRDVLLLDNFVKNNKELLEFAEGVSMITKLNEGYSKPKEYWLAETITSDLQKLADTYYRDLALAEFIENREVIFGTWNGGRLVGKNMNKIEALYGTRHREAMENILWRMENGTNRPHGSDAITNKWMNWVNRSGGAIMFFNVKSAALQTISSLNYMNGTFNNPFRAAQAFANQKQYWSDFVKIFNSDMLLQRRSGLKINVEANELLSALDGKSGKAERALAYLLEKGFIPTKYADSFAIASGGATYYRNRVRHLKKKGMSEAGAEKQAWIDFTELTEATQQSSRPDFISAQQASPIGRPILMFANTPMQMFRRHKRRIQDIANRRGNMAENLMSALYYGVGQSILFSYLANAVFAKDEEDPEKEDFNEKKDARFYETVIDSYMRGMGTLGAVPSAIKNALLEFKKQNEKDWNSDYAEVVYDLLNVSPPIGSKVRKVVSSLKGWKYNKEIIPEMGFDIDNPAVSMGANLLSAGLNIPADRLLLKINNLRDASNSDYETWQRIALLTGINRWSLGLGKREAVEEAKEKVKKEKEVIRKEEQKIKKEKKKKEKEKEEEKVIEDNIEKQKKEKKEGKKEIKCAAVSKSGKRCKTNIEPGSVYCTVHVKVEQGTKEVQCKKIKSNKKRCKMKTKAKSGYCYYHD